MAEERKDSFAETVDTAASAAHTVKGAIKAGKAISGAAKGAAAGGPYGAVAGAVWAGRKHIGKIIAVIITLLLLPVLFVLMLPGLIFGGLINAFSPADTEQPILNSETAIVESANDITFTINSILGEALDDVMTRIEADFASSGADQMEVKNPYSAGPVYNANLIVSQYCAARDEDFESISLDDLAAVLRENKEHLYSYTSVRESREVTSEDPETGEETTTTEIWMVYTIRYNGESYLADHIFALTDEQKELASDYASNLSMFLGDGLLQNLTEWTGNSIPSLGDVTFTDGVTPVVYFNQLDERYASQPYGTDNIGGYGCGPTAMSIVVSSLTDETVDPVAMAQWSYVTKPFSMPVLLEKIRVILRRRGNTGEDSRLRYRDLTLDLDTREALLDGQLLDLTAREFELLHTFLAAPGRVFTREMLLAKLWGYDFYGDERVVDSHIKNLRHKLGRNYIDTVRGVGYRAAKEDR